MSVSGRPLHPQRLAEEISSPSLPGDPFVAAERYGRAAWYRLRTVRQWKTHRDRVETTIMRRTR